MLGIFVLNYNYELPANSKVDKPSPSSHPIVPPVCHIPFLPVYISSPCMYHPMCDLILHEQDPT